MSQEDDVKAISVALGIWGDPDNCGKPIDNQITMSVARRILILLDRIRALTDELKEKQ